MVQKRFHKNSKTKRATAVGKRLATVPSLEVLILEEVSYPKKKRSVLKGALDKVPTLEFLIREALLYPKRKRSASKGERKRKFLVSEQKKSPPEDSGTEQDFHV
ncbi:hypothetical protein AMTRI_Chr02g219670 [Amborella trichopoda]|uniref:Uncharacterized protein n=1 Tax=Amborella trichopoda TaxID=13333 RepID=W1NUN7_AMBTC|nr:hypothetical protein AMTR_s01369p00001280 [Amborella trichopoda]